MAWTDAAPENRGDAGVWMISRAPWPSCNADLGGVVNMVAHWLLDGFSTFAAGLFPGDWAVFAAVGVLVVLFALTALSGMRYIPNNRVGVVEKLWSGRGSVPEGRI